MEYIYLHKKLSFCFIAKKYIFVTSAEQFPKRVEQLSRSPEYCKIVQVLGQGCMMNSLQLGTICFHAQANSFTVLQGGVLERIFLNVLSKMMLCHAIALNTYYLVR